MTSRISPHMKSFIRSVVLSEISLAETSKSYKWKDALFKEVLSSIIDNLNDIESDVSLKEEIKKEISKRRIEINKTLDMVENTLGNVPLELIKKQQ